MQALTLLAVPCQGTGAWLLAYVATAACGAMEDVPPPGKCCMLQHRCLASKFKIGANLLSTLMKYAGTALVEELDKLLMVQLRDGRKILGILRCLLVTRRYRYVRYAQTVRKA